MKYLWKVFTPFLALFYLISVVFSNEDGPIVHLKNGQVRGIEQVVDGHKINLYNGIRYGRAKRFSIPEPVEPWSGVYDATKWRDACPQVLQTDQNGDFMTKTISEDCLYVNVWQPVNNDTNRAVMVWIHGGAYFSGTIFATFYDGKYIAAQNVVVVSINYRLGQFGFFYAGTDDAPGNVGLHDQLLALQWVSNNIHKFGGDPNKVTIFGESAGSFAVGSLIISPLSQDLFQRAIMQSGSPTSHDAFQTRKEAIKTSLNLALNVQCPIDSMQTMVDCLRNKTTEQVLKGFSSDINKDQFFKPIFGDELLPVQPTDAMKTNRFNKGIDLMFGVTSHEGSSFAEAIAPNLKSGKDLTIEMAKEDIRFLMNFYKQPFAEEVVQFYTNEMHNPSQTQLKQAVADVWGDFHLTCGTILFGEEFASQRPEQKFYSYRLTKPTGFLNCTGWRGVCHAEDIIYLFAIPFIQQNVSLYKQSQDMIHAWTSFAKTGNPGKMGNVEWTEAFDRSTHSKVTKHMNLDSSDYQMIPNYFEKTCDVFWKPKIF